ncbi:dihydroorotate dehydrogenase electron transfer subunit [Paenisporosarcina sp. OV554]|uniref:dihydroorotate dehydrogenase electron transfer subunit n=1 Tax=Paenisporosarcina sp. OV554 TaxID=2135694 RepID=UPI000D3933FD|nr:dihydroorotate dehydrogenase electron transfer subunit [Paenisporosarcina sp. OV554]PUB18117.1 dihydroorotate oxidase B electron transfer subunit [Paenisporosarcina sp. OV554]
MIRQERMRVVKHREIAHNIYEMTLIGQLVHEMKSPGQFVHIRVSDSYEPLLRRPISIASIDRETLEFTIIYRAEGRGTSMLATKNIGDEVDVLGPLGNGFPIDEAAPGETVVLVGGGIGVPPLYELSKRLVEKGVKPIHILGFQTKEVVFYEELFGELGETHVVTVDGTHGHQGFVTTVLAGLKTDFSTYFTCGPTAMLVAMENMYPDKKGFLSFEERMGCGLGACFACVCKTTEQTAVDYVKVCSDGPVFAAGVVHI